MAHNGSSYIKSLCSINISAHHLSYVEAAQLESILQDDAKDYFYSATISTANGLSSIESGNYSWATVQFYYSNFYILRGLLALKKICIFYDGRTPYSIEANPSEIKP